MPVFRDASRYAAMGCVLKPLLVQYLDQDLDLTVHIVNVQDRLADGWFHASSHPMLPEHELQAYLGKTEPRGEPAGYGLRMSMLVGSFMHEVVRQALNDLKIMVPLQKYCLACRAPREQTGCREHGTWHEATRSRGHLDGIIDLGVGRIFGVDLKTIRTFGLKDAPDMDAAYFRATWPKYWYQVQDYMRMSGLRRYIVLFMAMGSPWELREYHIDFDTATAVEIETKYSRALRAAGQL